VLKEVCRIADRLAVWLGKSVTEPRLTDQALFETIVDESGSTVSQHMLVQTVLLEDHASCVNKLGATTLENLTETLSQVNLPGESYYVLFRHALNATDPASKFLAMYQILAAKHEDNQDKIDKFLKQQGVEETKTRPKGQLGLRKETTFTRLRNEYMHDRRREYEKRNHERRHVTTAQIRAEMKANLDSLISIVRTAITRP